MIDTDGHSVRRYADQWFETTRKFRVGTHHDAGRTPAKPCAHLHVLGHGRTIEVSQILVENLSRKWTMAIARHSFIDYE